MRTLSSALLVLLLLACVTPSRVERADGRSTVLANSVRALRARETVLREERAHAADVHRKVLETYTEASDVAVGAAARFREADARWRLAQWVIVAAAMLDAHLAEGSRSANIDIDCADGMSVGAFRRYLTSLGVALAGLSIDHIVPLKVGGANHPANYRITTISENSSWGGHWGADKCRYVGDRCAAAVKASRMCGSFDGRMPAL